MDNLLLEAWVIDTLWASPLWHAMPEGEQELILQSTLAALQVATIHQQTIS